MEPLSGVMRRQTIWQSIPALPREEKEWIKLYRAE